MRLQVAQRLGALAQPLEPLRLLVRDGGDRGAVAQLASSDYQRFEHPAVRIDLGGTEARAQVDDIVGRVTVYRAERAADLWQPSLIRDRLDLGSTAVAAVRAFAAAIQAGQPAPVPGEQGLQMLRIERACVRSQRLGQPVGLDEA